ncbi:MAG: pilus assembly protein [Nocardioidaceae bacterium]|nr:pilus assembly protein [Nocardioidaceae bacterium]
METALCLCFIVLPLVFATIAYAYMLSFRQTVSQSAAEGARIAAVAPSTASDADRKAAAIKAASQSMDTGVGDLKCNEGSLTCTAVMVPGCEDGSTATCVKVTISYPYRDKSLLPTIPGLGFTLPKTISYAAMVQVS